MGNRVKDCILHAMKHRSLLLAESHSVDIQQLRATAAAASGCLTVELARRVGSQPCRTAAPHVAQDRLATEQSKYQVPIYG